MAGEQRTSAGRRAAPRAVSSATTALATIRAAGASNRLAKNSDRLQNKDQQRRPQDRHYPAHDGATSGQAQDAGQPEPQGRADDADHDVGYGAHLRVGLHDDAGQPADNGAYD